LRELSPCLRERCAAAHGCARAEPAPRQHDQSPGLAFANRTAGDGASVAYGAVYPLTMILRVVTAQLLVIFWVA
jgi:hypothetical protein